MITFVRMSDPRPLRAASEHGRVYLQLPGVRSLVTLSPAEAATLARAMLALPEVRDHEAREVSRILHEDIEQDES
ncbi:MAG: hypothetical protein EOO75_03160 [Myxococcales bacterium]|nr:MAG: hypothetical protein EOO75_03160 [Myxococcales bacterium]